MLVTPMVGPHLEDQSDEDLLRAFVSEGDQDALETLLRRHEARVYGLAYRTLGNRADALDATQEVFLKVIRKGRLFRRRSAFSTWLYRLTINLCTDMLRRQARRNEVIGGVETEAPAEASVAERLDVEAALKSLPEDQRVVLVLRDIYGLTYAEIAETLEVPEGTVKSRIARGREALAGLLGELDDRSGRLNEGEE
jgi:RNA polymerase sigma-70 factor (ECF subfamily)